MLRAGQTIVVCVFALLTLGVLMINSASMSVGQAGPPSLQSILLSRSTILMALALLAMGVVVLFAPVLRLSRFGQAGSAALDDRATGWSLWPLWAGLLVLLAMAALVYIPHVASARKGSSRWIAFNVPGLGQQTMQPSELVKWGLVLLMAWYATVMGPRLARFWTGLAPALVVIGASAGIVVLEDLGTGVLIAGAAVLVLIAGGARLWQFLLLLPLALGAFAAAVIAEPYRMHRITSFLDPYADAQDKGFHMIQSMVAVANGEIFGRGLGHGLQKFEYLPEDTTDFLFAIICEELGLFGAGLVVALYAGLILAGLAVVRRQSSPMLKLLALGIISAVGLQAIINLAVVTGLGPTKGIALPLLSSGGTGWILTAAALGVVVAIDRLSDEPALSTTAFAASTPPLPATTAPAPASPGEPTAA
jgi:cell division protein FtsW